MKRSITTLALNLLISERQAYRKSLADSITDVLKQRPEVFENDLERRNTFLSLMDECVADPTCEARKVFYQMAHYYNQQISTGISKVFIAA